jgi:hypothetical protein
MQNEVPAFRLSSIALIVASALAACSGQRITFASPDVTYTTTPFEIVPENIAYVVDTAVEDSVLVLYVEVGACTRPENDLLTLRVHGAPHGVFREGQWIAVGIAQIKRLHQLAIRAVTPEELTRFKCKL